MRLTSILFLALAAAASTQPVQWHTPGVNQTTLAHLNHFERDQWINAEAKDDGLQIDLPQNGYSDVMLTDRFDYSEQGVMQIKIDTMQKASVTVQAVCYDDEGKIFTYVDLLEYLEAPGTYEVPMKIYRTPLKGTRRIAFKIWVAGDHPSTTISNVAYGTP